MFFLSGGQIDGAGNINLVGIGDYRHPKVRFPGSFGSSYMYYVVPKVILFRLERSRRTLVEKVDFISAPGTSPANVFRPGGPVALVTDRCLFAFDRDRRRVSDRILAYALFIDPPLGRAGMNEAEARKSGRRVLAAKMPMTRVGRAREAGETQGFMKVLVDADSKELLGASLLGLNADEVVHSLLDIMYAKKPYTTIQRAVHIHPTVTELIPTLLGNLKPLA